MSGDHVFPDNSLALCASLGIAEFTTGIARRPVEVAFARASLGL
ncbi:hypothetical protein NB311A_06798 [Nitrobacter sp. Nb-311A]|nr:hypothetical protein [Nitrobacter sp.]EAQ33458.1 hypothetical protein NB311A_06798 [Nitrobacter sp. Nb-311A]